MLCKIPDLHGRVSTCIIGSSAAWIDSRGSGSIDIEEEVEVEEVEEEGIFESCSKI